MLCGVWRRQFLKANSTSASSAKAEYPDVCFGITVSSDFFLGWGYHSSHCHSWVRGQARPPLYRQHTAMIPPSQKRNSYVPAFMSHLFYSSILAYVSDFVPSSFSSWPLSTCNPEISFVSLLSLSLWCFLFSSPPRVNWWLPPSPHRDPS